MRKEWWIAIGIVIAIFVAIVWSAVLNENAYQVECQQRQRLKEQNDSIMLQLLLEIDSVKEGMRNIEEISASLREGQREQLKNDTLNRKELQQLGRRVHSSNR